MSLVAVTSVIDLLPAFFKSSSIAGFASFSSARYRFLNSANFAGSWPYHFRSSVEGASSLAHRSIGA